MADDQHITHEILRALDQGELSLHDLYRLSRHLTSLCPECKRAVESYRKDEVRPAISDRVAAVIEESSRRAARLDREKARCREILERLRRLPHEDRAVYLASETPPALLLELLLEEIRSHLTEDPSVAIEWAELALEALQVVHDALPSQQVFVHAAYANAMRAAGDLNRAQAALAHTRELARAHHTEEPHVIAELDCLEGTLATDLRQFGRAEHHLRRAARLFEKLGDSAGSARTFLKLGSVHAYAGNLEAALDATRAASRFVAPDRSPRLYLYARFNIAHILVDMEDYQQAFDYLEWDRELYAQNADRHLELRLRWLDGRIAAGTSRPREAEWQFLRVRDGFADLGIGFDVALVSLDLALLYHQQGRLEDLKHAAIEAALLFERHAVHREALAALTMLRDAALEERVTAATIERIAEFVRTAARDPRARFVPPN
ncbi:MAG: hypothetical protein PVG07_08755 [Acidobacteriota bacterium]|jgi:tetratricopeptide (TPR) repeat protein